MRKLLIVLMTLVGSTAAEASCDSLKGKMQGVFESMMSVEAYMNLLEHSDSSYQNLSQVHEDLRSLYAQATEEMIEECSLDF